MEGTTHQARWRSPTDFYPPKNILTSSSRPRCVIIIGITDVPVCNAMDDEWLATMKMLVIATEMMRQQ